MGEFRKFLISFPVLECFFFFKKRAIYPSISWDKLFQEFRDTHLESIQNGRDIFGEKYGPGVKLFEKYPVSTKMILSGDAAQDRREAENNKWIQGATALLPHQEGH